ncbi:hypothetical protein MLD38_012266 [Melastoma candidum]|uniref:Uncharacterized protein n=1 Tax=Melastoma candidum TaxID=119954 RepID=A0ACB9R9Y8_9MYRT|nr:hypothetical protein MLD38_012266 [Melastoma candidum]
MEASAANSDVYRGSSGNVGGVGVSSVSGGGNNSLRRYNSILAASNIIRSPISTLLEYSGILRTRSNHQESEPLFSEDLAGVIPSQDDDSGVPAFNGEVSIRIIGAGEQEHHRDRGGLVVGQTARDGGSVQSNGAMRPVGGIVADDGEMDARSGLGESGSQSINGAEGVEGGEASGRESSYQQRYDIQQAARWIEQILPFSLLLLVVFIRQHLQGTTGFFITIWIAAVLYKSNDILRKQTALKGERKVSILVGISLTFTFHVVGVYWWYRHEDLFYPLFMFPPKAIPPFWHAIFIIIVNDALVRQAAMVIKCLLLIYFKNSRGRNYRKQGQLLTLVEYMLLLYRALLPTPIWYRFFLNKEYGSLFSSLMTGLYLTFKLTSIVEKVQSFFAALRALSRKEVHYGAHATPEQVCAAGDLCAICQEKMHSPVLLRCKHIFCEDCVSEWFERERTCPLCRALVKPADLKSFGDGSTNLFFQVF